MKQPKTNTLIIGKQTAKTLSKSQQIFNRLSQKIEKESLMKQLTAAYETHDLHMLLRLEIQ